MKVVFHNYPFLLGESFSITLKNLPLNEITEPIELNLRFIEEDYSNEILAVGYQYYFDQKILTAKDFYQIDDLRVEWKLPDDTGMTTHLSNRPAQFWQLEVKCQTSQGEYRDWFILPIYSTGESPPYTSPFQWKKPVLLEDYKLNSLLKADSRPNFVYTSFLIFSLFIVQIILFVNGDSLGYWKYLFVGIISAGLIVYIKYWWKVYKSYMSVRINQENNKILWEFDFSSGVDGILGHLNGKSKLHFDRFPFFLGDSLQVRVSSLPPKDTIKDLTLNLRVIQKDSAYAGGKALECYLEQKKVFVRDLDSNGDLPVEWLLPDNPEFTTKLFKLPSIYWELELKAKTTGVDYHQRFLLPIYAKA